MRKKPLIPALAGLIAVLGLAIAGCSGGASDPAFKPGPLACDGLGTKSYHYTVNVTEEVKALASTPAPPATLSPHGASPGVVTWDIQGVVQGGNKVGSIDAKQHNAVEGGSGDVETIALEGGATFYNIGQGWLPSSTGPTFPPLNLCNSLAPDADTTKLGVGVPEAVNGVASLKFSFQGLSSLFIAREPEFAGGDAGAWVRTLNGAVWVAEKGNLITKLDVTVTGQYPNGQPISVAIKFEVSDLGGDIKVVAPISS
jgi:hypothetical protein